MKKNQGLCWSSILFNNLTLPSFLHLFQVSPADQTALDPHLDRGNLRSRVKKGERGGGGETSFFPFPRAGTDRSLPSFISFLFLPSPSPADGRRRRRRDYFWKRGKSTAIPFPFLHFFYTKSGPISTTQEDRRGPLEKGRGKEWSSLSSTSFPFYSRCY